MWYSLSNAGFENDPHRCRVSVHVLLVEGPRAESQTPKLNFKAGQTVDLQCHKKLQQTRQYSRVSAEQP